MVRNVALLKDVLSRVKIHNANGLVKIILLKGVFSSAIFMTVWNTDNITHQVNVGLDRLTANTVSSMHHHRLLRPNKRDWIFTSKLFRLSDRIFRHHLWWRINYCQVIYLKVAHHPHHFFLPWEITTCSIRKIKMVGPMASFSYNWNTFPLFKLIQKIFSKWNKLLSNKRLYFILDTTR